MKPLKLILFIFVFTHIAFALPQFLLVSELHTQLLSSPQSSLIWTYSYDADGNRSHRYIYVGNDTSSALNSLTSFGYNTDGTVASELVSINNDTASLALFSYNLNGLLTSVSVYGDSLRFRYCDSLSYNGSLLSEQRRYNKNLAMTSYHQFSYNTIGQKTSDSTFEKSGSGFISVKAVTYQYGTNGKVAKEEQFRKVVNSWYKDSTSLLVYSGDHLQSTTIFGGAPSASTMCDSFAYSYDFNGNRQREEHYNSERVLAYTIDYTWKNTDTGIFSFNRQNQLPEISSVSGYYTQGKLFLSTTVSSPMSIAIYNGSGRLIYRNLLQGNNLDISLVSGRYFAYIFNKSLKRSFNFSVIH